MQLNLMQFIESVLKQCVGLSVEMMFNYASFMDDADEDDDDANEDADEDADEDDDDDDADDINVHCTRYWPVPARD